MPLEYLAAVELAKVLFAGISATAAAITAWRASRSRKKAAQEFDNKFEAIRESPEAKDAATELVAAIPPEVLEALEARADECWANYRTILGGSPIPDPVVEKATAAVRACVCRELRLIRELHGAIPSRWTGQWELYQCNEKDGQGVKIAEKNQKQSRVVEEPQPA